MALLVPNQQTGYAHGEAPELDRKLREGDGLAWRGDPDLSLSMGILTNRRGDIVARRYEVYRHTELGEDVLIGHWRLEEFDRILMDMVAMDPRTPGHVAIEDRIDAANAALDKANSEEARGHMAEAMEHALKLHHDTTEPQNVFRQVGGFADDKPAAE